MNEFRGHPASGRSAQPIQRRRFLRGIAGAVLGLPFLESLTPRVARGQAQVPIQRFAVFFCCNGVNVPRWFPKLVSGPLLDEHLLGTANEPLLPFRDKLLFPRGIHMAPRGYNFDGGGADDHGKGMAHKLTAQFAEPEKWFALGPSLDHVLAARINPGREGARRAPLNLMVGRFSGERSLDYISYSDARMPVAALNSPWTAYAELTGLTRGAAPTPEAEELVLRRRQSVIDLVSEQFADLRRRDLSIEDDRKLEQHLAAIRDVELRISDAGLSCAQGSIGERVSAYAPSGDSEADLVRVSAQRQYPLIADLQIDILALALACDATRVATLQFDRGAGGPTFNWEGIHHEYNHHKISHGKVRDDCFGSDTSNGCDNVDGYRDMLFDIDRWHQSKLARLLGRLSSYVEADGNSVLDNSVVLYTNELSDGRQHSFTNQPYILAGSAAGVFKQGEQIALGDPSDVYSERAPHNRLLNTLLNAFGVPSDWFGTRTGGRTMQGGIYDELLR